MSVINDILSAVIDMAEATNPYATIIVGSLPPDNGLSMTFGAGGVNTTTLEKTICYDFSVVLNGKHSSQKTVSDALCNIHAALTQTKTYPATSAYQIADISTIATPSYLDREDSGQWLYGSSLRVRAYVFNT